MKKTHWLLARFLFVFAVPFVAIAAVDDVLPVEWSPHGGWSGCHMNMGPTGARVWMRGYQFEVMTVDKGAPADGVLFPGDRVVGVEDVTFSSNADSRMTLGDAIGRAEATDGKLELAVRRDGRAQRVTLRLAAMGPFAANWPYGCMKSQRVLHGACEYLLEAQLPDGSIVTDGGMGTFLGGLLLLASGEARFLDGARRAAYATATMDFEKMETHNWPMGYGGLLLAEYYLATGDERVLPKLQAICDHFAKGQMRCGSWGHIGPSAGYGAMNQAGIVCTITLVLAHECGLKVDRKTLNRALSFYGRYAELGAVPYGDHPPGVHIPDDNGKSASTAVLCSLLPEWLGASGVFAQSVAMSYWMRETGHTGGFFSMVWGPLACSLAGKGDFQRFMDYQEWHYNLCRTWRGALVMLPYYEALTRFDDSSYNFFGGEFTTGGMALVFALPHRKLRILGAPRSAFGAKLAGPLQQARACYQSREWEAFENAVAVARKSVESPEEKRWLAQLDAAAAVLRASTDRTVREVENALDEGDPYRASEQYRALTRLLGEDEETIQSLAKRFEDGTVQWHVRMGAQYYQAWHDLRAFGFQSWIPYGITAKPLVGDVPPLRPRVWQTLAATSKEAPGAWSVWPAVGPVSGRRSFNVQTTDYVALRIRVQSPRNAHTRVRLNGTLVADVVRGQRSGYAKIALDDSALALLREGGNTLEIDSTSAGSGGNALDVGLDGIVCERPLTTTPEWTDSVPVSPLPEVLRTTLERARKTASKMPMDDAPDPSVPERLRVRDSHDRFRAALAAACDALDTDVLMEAMRSPIPYWRYLVSAALARRGTEGVHRAVSGLRDKDWRVRSACCDVLTLAHLDADGNAKAGDAPGVDDVLPAHVTALLSDRNAWVRCRAAAALGAGAKADATVAMALAEGAADSDDWVREAALSAIDKVTDDPGMLVKAAAGALRVPSTSFSLVNRSIGLIEAHGADGKTVIPSLVFAVEHPGEGMWAQSINTVMAKLVELDPEGRAAVSALAKVAAGGYAYDRLRGNPRKTAIDLLGKLGKKASSAEPVLERIVARTSEEEPLRDAARAALELVR